jgi:8-oxo-dGTP diphosphatase
MRERATVICRREGRFLLVRKADSRWLFPGGKVKRGELPISAAIRELHEETGLVPSAVAYLFQFGGKANLHHVFETPVSDLDVPCPLNEIAECDWFLAGEVSRLATSAATIGILEHVRSQQ